MAVSDSFYELDQIFRDILSGVSAAGRTRSARAVGRALRRSQQRRIAAQQNADGTTYQARRRRVIRVQQGMKFLWNGEARTLKNWQHGQGKYGKTITGYDQDRKAIRTFYRSDIARYLEIKTGHVSQSRQKNAPMFARLRTARYMKLRADASGVAVGFSGLAARIARVHQLGLRDQVGPNVETEYPVRELLGFTRADEKAIQEAVIASLGRGGK
ncbi:phage virion morphogenesis protein [Klebsiella pneumoniae]|uniref:phage virion morphogenesis protein n=1 Tax=Klebsiella pneumoniae TaxID=573 RepID=UPI003F7CED13